MTELSLEFYSGKRLFGGCQKMDGYEPIAEGEFGVLHDRSKTNFNSVMTVFTFVTELVGFPIMRFATTFGANLNLCISYFFQFLYARGLVRILGYKF